MSCTPSHVPDTLWVREEIICVVINAVAADVMATCFTNGDISALCFTSVSRARPPKNRKC